MNSQASSSEQKQYTVYGDIRILPAHYLQSNGLESLKGVEGVTSPVAPLFLQAELLEDNWVVTATIGPNDEVGSIRCDPGTKREEALHIAETWVRSSEHIKVIEGSMKEIPLPASSQPSAALGMILVQDNNP